MRALCLPSRPVRTWLPLVALAFLALLPTENARALQVIPFDEETYRALSDCVVEARFEGTRAAPATRADTRATTGWTPDIQAAAGVRTLAYTELLLRDAEVVAGDCGPDLPRVVLPAWTGGQFWAGAPRLREGSYYRLHLHLRDSGTPLHIATPLGLSEGIRPARISDGHLEKFRFYETREGLPWRWPEGEVTFRLHAEGSAGLSYEELAGAVEEALQMWSAPDCASITLRLGEPWAGDVETFPEDINSIALWDGQPPVGNPAVIALTLHDVDDETGEIRQTWIAGNAATRAWSVDGRAGAFDVRGIMAHEIGHAIGFGHSEVREAVMYERIADSRSSAWRVLDEDDVEGLCALYPCGHAHECAAPFPDPDPAAGAGLGVCGACAADAACGGVRDLCLLLPEEGRGSGSTNTGPSASAREGAGSLPGASRSEGPAASAGEAGDPPSRAGGATESGAPAPEDGRCMRECGALLPCPDGFVCAPLLGERTLRQCVPVDGCPVEEAFVCAPCQEDGDCGGPRGRCVRGSEGRGGGFCAYVCDDGLGCPQGFVCADAPPGSGGGQLCLPEEGACPRISGGGCSAAGRSGAPWGGWLGVLLALVALRRGRTDARSAARSAACSAACSP